MSVWLGLFVIVVASLGTYVMRAGMIVALADSTMPPLVVRALNHVPAAVLAAMTMTLAANPDTGGLTVDKVAALLVGSSVALWKQNLVYTVIAGMATLHIVAALV